MSGSSFSTWLAFHHTACGADNEATGSGGEEWKGDGAQTWDGGGGMRPDCWWSLMKHPTRHNSMTQNQKLTTYSPILPCILRHCVHSCTICHWNWSVLKVQGANRPHMQERREKKAGKQLNTNCLPVIHFPSFVSLNEPNQKNPHVEKLSLSPSLSLSPHLVFLPVSSVILPCHYVETELNSKSLRSGNLLWYGDMAEKKWQCNKLCSSDVPPCVQLSVSTVWGEKSKCRKLGGVVGLLWLPLEDVQKSSALTPNVLGLLLYVLI